ncbi:MAG: hypothetical protein H7343_07025 [Undibacterium sp.]|nr:hypothetical protein [Opitutaceae bacterium]
MPFFTLVTLTALTSPARAHDPYEAFHSAALSRDRLEMIITMSPTTALRLIDPAARIPRLTPENFHTHRSALLREAAVLFRLTSTGRPLPAQSTAVELTDENDVVFRVTYPRPGPGALAFSATYLARLGDGYGGLFEVTDGPKQKNLGWEQLLWSRPDFEIALPP